MELYKLTDQNGNTRGGMHWDVGITNSVKPTDNPRLCSPDVIHAYKGVNLAFILNPIHADLSNPLLWRCDGDICIEDWGKVGCFNLSVVSSMGIPEWVGDKLDSHVRVSFAILCAESVLSIWNNYDVKDKRIVNAIETARKYLHNKNTDVYAARAAYAAYAADAADAAARAAYAAAADAAARAAARAAYTAAAAYAADAAAAYAAYAAAAYAARAATHAAYAAAHAADMDSNINFSLLADKAVKEVSK